MKAFVSDLDNTIIFSYKKDIGKDKVLVEKKLEKELSFMSSYSHNRLEILDRDYNFIPLTTRSLEQYRRINFFKKQKIKIALIANGGILLENDKIVDNWYEESLSLVKESLEELKKAREILAKRDEIFFEIKLVDGLFIFTKSNKTEITLESLKEGLDLSLVDINNHKEKIYVFPKNINKGKSLERLRNFYKFTKIVVAGDSEMDIPMLERGDISIFPTKLEKNIKKNKENYAIDTENRLFSDEVVDLAEKFFINQLEEEKK